MSTPTLVNIATLTLLKSKLNLQSWAKIIASQIIRAKKQKKMDLQIILTRNMKSLYRTLDLFSAYLDATSKIPLLFKAQLVTLSLAFTIEVYKFTYKIAKNVERITQHDLIFCINNLQYTNNCEIDKFKSYLNIMEKSEFSIKFPISLLLGQLIDSRTLTKVADKFISNKLLMVEGRRTRNAKKGVNNLRIKIDQYLSSIPNVNSYIESSVSRYWNEYNLNETWKCLAYIGNAKLIEYYLNSVDHSLKYDLTLKIAHFFVNEVLTYDVKVLTYLYRNLNKSDWTNVLESCPLEIFNSYLNDRRHRDLCVELYPSIVGNFEVNDFNCFLKIFLDADPYGGYEGVVMKQIFKNMWMATPVNLRKGNEETHDILMRLVIGEWEDIELFHQTVAENNPETLKRIYCESLLHAVANGPSEMVPSITDNLNKLEVSTKFRSELISDEKMKKFIISSEVEAEEKKFMSRLMFVTEFVFRRPARVNMFKNNLLSDNAFMVEFMQRHWNSKYLNIFLVWVTEMPDRINCYVNRVFNKEILATIYENIILRTGTTKEADKGFDRLVVKVLLKDDWQSIKKAVLQKPTVRRAIMTKYFRDVDNFCEEEFKREWSPIAQHNDTTKGFDKNDDWDIGFYYSLLTSNECKDALISMIVHVDRDSVEFGHIQHVYHYGVLQQVLFEPTSAKYLLSDLLLFHGHPNKKDTLYYCGRTPTAKDMPMVRKVVDYRYRLLVASLNNGYDMFFDRTVDFTELSQQFADRAYLDIPVLV